MKHPSNKHLKNKELYSIEFLRTDMTSDPSNYHKEYFWSFLSTIEYRFLFFKCLMIHCSEDWSQNYTPSLFWGQFSMEKLYEELIMCIINVSNGFPFLLQIYEGTSQIQRVIVAREHLTRMQQGGM